MKTHLIILVYALALLPFYSCFNTVQINNNVFKSGKFNNSSCITIDTLVLGEFTKDTIIIMDPIHATSVEETKVVRQVFYNNSADTLEIQIKSSGGWTYPEYNRFVLPQSYSVNYYYFDTKYRYKANQQVRTEFYIFLINKNCDKANQRLISLSFSVYFG